MISQHRLIRWLVPCGLSILACSVPAGVAFAQVQNCGYMIDGGVPCTEQPFPGGALPEECSDKVIRTDPYAAFNNEFPFRRNTFNWIDPNPDESTIKDEYCLNSIVLNDSHILTPYSQTDNSVINHIVGYRDYPKDGWELIKYDMGYGCAGTPTGVGVTYPYLVLYNRFTAVLRVFVAFSEINTAIYHIAGIRLSFARQNSQSTVPSNLDLSVAFSRPGVEGLASIKHFFNDRAGFVSAVTFANNPGTWLYADFPMMYDPCMCNHSSLMGIQVFFMGGSSITMTSTHTDTDIPRELVLDSDSNINKDQFGQRAWGYEGLNGFDVAIQKSVKGYKGTNELRQSIERAIDKSGLKPHEKVDKRSDIDELTSQSNSGSFLKAGIKASPWVSGATTLLDHLVIGGKKDAPSARQHPMGIELNSRYKGQIHPVEYRRDITFHTPGSKDYRTLNVNSSANYPYYNQPMGVFNLLESPLIRYSVPRQGSSPLENVIVIDPSEHHAWADWDPYQPNRHELFPPVPEGDVLSPSFFVDPFRHDVLFPTDGTSFAPEPTYYHVSHRYKLAGNPPYVVNPAAEFKDNPEILAAIFVEAYRDEPTGAAQGPASYEAAAGIGFVLGSNFNLLSEGKGFYRTHWMPLSCLEDMTVEFATALGTKIRVSLKVMANFERGDGYADANTQNVFHTWKFAARLEPAPVLMSFDSPFSTVALNVSLDGAQTLTSDLAAWERVVIADGAVLSAPNPVCIIAGTEIIVSPTARLSPNITLKIASPNGCTDKYAPVGRQDTDVFCNANYTVGNRAVPLPGNFEDDPIFLVAEPQDAAFAVHVVPNPVHDLATLRAILPRGGDLSAHLSGLRGQVVAQLGPWRALTAGEHFFEVPMQGLPAGMYILTVRSAAGTKSVKVVKR